MANAQVEEIRTAEESPWVPLDPSARLAANSSWQGSWLQNLETVWKGWRKKRSLFPAWKASSAVLDAAPAMFRRGKGYSSQPLLNAWEAFNLSSRTDLGPLEQQSEGWESGFLLVLGKLLKPQGCVAPPPPSNQPVCHVSLHPTSLALSPTIQTTPSRLPTHPRSSAS